MDFYEILDQIIALLRQRGRVSYQALKRQFDVDDAYLDDLKVELIEVQELARDRDGKMLVWSGEAARIPESTPAPATQERISPASTAHAGPPIAHTPPYLAEKILTSRTALEGERKQVTVLFADIKDSTELIKDLDPEDAQKLLDPAIHMMMDAVHRFEGTVNQVLGDGIMALFGAPIAHEDHALRACYAALAMQAATQDYTEEVRRSYGMSMRIRVGLNSGEVVVRTIGNDLHMDYSAVGHTTNLASRMEQLAAPDSITLPSTTLRLVEGLVQSKPLGPVPVKGMTEPVEVYELTGVSAIRRRLQAAATRGLTQFVGRGAEIEVLNQALKQAGAGHGQVVAAVGEAGVGKSRFVYEFIHSHRTQGWLVLESASVSYGKATPYIPVVDLLKRYVHIDGEDDPRTIRAKVTGHILTLAASLQETIPAVLSLLGALPDDSPFLQLDPPQRRQRTHAALKRILLRESQVQPLLLVFEDLHWIDSETQVLLDSLVESLPTAQLLLLVNYRPEYQHAWGNKTYYTQLRLDPLPYESAEAFLAVLIGNDPSLEPLKKLLIERTEGNPFFLEESVRTLVETQVLVGESGTYRLAQALPAIQVPPTVQAVLAARIDRLPQDAKRLLQTAAVIGTEVPFSLLQAISELSAEALYRSLTHLQTAEFLYETSLFPEHVYTFKHALTHEVAYGSLLQERRRVLHARIVEALEVLGADRLEDQVERLAHHAFRGEVWEKAFVYYRQTGAKAVEQSASREAMMGFDQALAVLPHLCRSRLTIEQEIDLRLDRRHALLNLAKFGQLHDELRMAETLAEDLGDPHRLGRVSSYLAHYYCRTGDNPRAITSGQRALTLAMAHGDFALQVSTENILSMAYWSMGDYEQARDVSKRLVESLKGNLVYERFGRSSFVSVLALNVLTWCLAERGEFAEGMQYGEQAIRIAKEADHPDSYVRTFSLGYLYLCKGDMHKALPSLTRGVAVCQEANILGMFPFYASELGYAYALLERINEAVSLAEQAVQQAVEMKATGFQSHWVARLSMVYRLAGRIDEANSRAEDALALARQHQEYGFQAQALHLLGDVAMHHDPPDIKHAGTHYHQALTLANELGMRPLQAHCHRGLGILYRQTGLLEQARAELSTAIEMYRAMEMMFWLPEAEAALSQVE